MSLPLRTVSLLAVGSFLAGACGSTAQIGGGAPAAAAGPVGDAAPVDGRGDGLELVAAPTEAGSTTPAVGGTEANGTSAGPATSAGVDGPTASTSGPGDRSGGGPGRTTPTGAGEGASGGGGTGDSSSVAPGTPGVTDTQIHVGFVYTENANAGNEALGFEEVTRGDQKRYHEILVEHINATGGIAGRELVPVYHVLDGASNQSTGEAEQQICATWTQDNEVFVGVTSAATDNLRQCLDNAGVSLISVQGLGASDDQTFSDFPYTVEPTNLSLNPMARLTVSGLEAQGYFERPDAVTPTKVGVITYDYPTFRRAVANDMSPALEALGLDVADPVYIKFPERQSDAGEVSAQLSNTVLRFRSAGVTHVLIFELNALLTVLFMNNADPQNYRPRYGFNTQNGGQLLVGLVPERQLHGTLQVGWLPLLDVLDVPAWPARDSCLGLYQRHDVQFDSKNAEAVGMVYCDMYESLRMGIENATGPLSRETLAGGFQALGTSFQSALVRDVRLGPGRRYGVTSYRTGAYDPGCTCFRYTGGPFAID